MESIGRGRPLHDEFILHGGGFARGRLPVSPETRCRDVLLPASVTGKRTLVGVKPLVKFQVDELGEFGRAQVARVRLLARMKPKMCLQVARATESLVAYVALVRLLSYTTDKERYVVK